MSGARVAQLVFLAGEKPRHRFLPCTFARRPVWWLPLSKEKAKLLHLRGLNPICSYDLPEHEMTSVDQATDLGFLPNANLTFDL